MIANVKLSFIVSERVLLNNNGPKFDYVKDDYIGMSSQHINNFIIDSDGSPLLGTH